MLDLTLTVGSAAMSLQELVVCARGCASSFVAQGNFFANA